MGTWGAGLYQSDVATDVRAVYRDCKKLGFSGNDLAAIVLDTVGGRILQRTKTGSSRTWRWRTCSARTGCFPRR